MFSCLSVCCVLKDCYLCVEEVDVLPPLSVLHEVDAVAEKAAEPPPVLMSGHLFTFTTTSQQVNLHIRSEIVHHCRLVGNPFSVVAVAKFVSRNSYRKEKSLVETVRELL